MSTTFSQLVWLGANTASEPAGLLDRAKRAVLIEAREVACKALQKKFLQKDVVVKQCVLTTSNGDINFSEYNLAEFSAAQPASGLTNLFPGLKKINDKTVSGTAINEVIQSLNLSDDNNLLIVDIADSSLVLLRALENFNQLHRFSEIYVQTASEPLYTGAPTSEEITYFLYAKGYSMRLMLSNDPDLPWLRFSFNPVWNIEKKRDNRVLSVSQQSSHSLGLIKSLKEELDKTAEENIKRALELSALSESLQNQIDNFEKNEVGLEADELLKNLQRKSVQIQQQQNQINELLLAQKALELENRKCNEKLKSCSEQLSRADVQYQLIKNLLVSRGIEGNENNQ